MDLSTIYLDDIQYLPDGESRGPSGINKLPQREGATAGAGNLPKTDPASALLITSQNYFANLNLNVVSDRGKTFPLPTQFLPQESGLEQHLL